MESLRTTLVAVVFSWMGIIFTRDTLDGLPREEWTSAVVRLGLGLTFAVVLVELCFQLVRRRRARRATATRAGRSDDEGPPDR